ncbi:hypothetical protein JHD46_05450 [Sulfurimonas sp. SAG-AH-194-C20]|nr:hypothetical protein [Sulfurimonas sp. SAG-AH-194-C20]MDF1879085.1 hypothetical protein [Sulfurimonas sp. SAG-AH-194-C20]
MRTLVSRASVVIHSFSNQMEYLQEIDEEDKFTILEVGSLKITSRDMDRVTIEEEYGIVRYVCLGGIDYKMELIELKPVTINKEG